MTNPCANLSLLLYWIRFRLRLRLCVLRAPTFVNCAYISSTTPSSFMTVSRAASRLSFVKGDLFTAPQKSTLVHACNTQGSWGGGIAYTFKQKFPAAFKEYKQHCEQYGEDLLGSCFIIAPDNEDGHAVACLFTSRRPGNLRDDPESILAATKSAVKDLLKKNKEGWPLHAWYEYCSLGLRST